MIYLGVRGRKITEYDHRRKGLGRVRVKRGFSTDVKCECGEIQTTICFSDYSMYSGKNYTENFLEKKM